MNLQWGKAVTDIHSILVVHNIIIVLHLLVTVFKVRLLHSPEQAALTVHSDQSETLGATQPHTKI